jgi:hypothetical protein
MSISPKTLVITLFFVMLIGVVSYLLFQQSTTNQENKPPITVSPLSLETAVSKFSVQIKSPHAPLRETSRQSLAKTFRDDAIKPEACFKDEAGKEKCEAIRGEYIAVSESVALGLVADNAFYVTVIFDITGKIEQLNEDSELASKLPRPFLAKVKTYSKIELSIGPDWCIQSKVLPNFNWIEGGNIRESDFRVKLRNHIESALAKELEKMAAGVVSTIQCDHIRQQVQYVWTTRSIPLEIPDNQQQQYIGIEPSSIGYTSLKLAGEKVEFDLNVIAKADISTRPITPDTMSLPSARILSHEDKTIDLALYYQVPYRKIVERLSADLIGNSMTSRTRYGTISVTTDSIEVYPFKDRLVIGLSVKSSNSEEWFSESSRLYLLVQPVSDQKNGLVQFTFDRFYDGIDPGLSLAAEETVVPVIEKLELANFKEPVEMTIDAINRVLEKENMIQDMAASSTYIKQTTLTGSAILVEIVFGFRADIRASEVSPENTSTGSRVLYDMPAIAE